MEQPKKRGRPPKEPGAKLERRAMYLPPNVWAKVDAYGNMSRGQITQLLNVLGTYTEAGYNKANAATKARLAKGSVKKNQYEIGRAHV